ncbi:GL16031 [Drosophila persimilis]|uniref:GL16031 n=1 Tax=Drosophila persimilis TaxID=7234 RepID=B4HDB9_DROPE|nr:GL16031 [Drosophila persimilis]
MSKDYEYNRKQKVWDPNERHTREDTLTEGVVGLVGIVGVTAIVTGLASKKVRSNIAKIFGRPPAAPKPGPRAPRPLLRTLNPLCTSPYDKKSSTASGERAHTTIEIDCKHIRSTSSLAGEGEGTV